MYSKSIYTFILLFFLSFLQAQSYEMSQEFMDQIQADSFAESIKVLHIKEKSSSLKKQVVPKLKDLGKLKSLKELVFEDWIYGNRMDTILRFDVNTFKQIVDISEQPQYVNTQELIALLPNYLDLEALTLSFQEQYSWESMHEYYQQAIYQQLEKELKPCLEGKTLASIYRSKASVLSGFANALLDNPINYNDFPLNRITGVENCINTAFVAKWRAYLRFEKGLEQQQELYKEDGMKYLNYFMPDGNADLAKPRDMPYLSRLQLLYTIRKRQFAQLARLGMRQVGVAGLSPAEQLASQVPKLKSLHLLEIKDYPDLQADLPQILKALAQLPKFEILRIENCNLEGLPKEIALLKNLKALYLPQNKFKTIGRGLHQLKTLEILDLSENPIQEYEESFYQIPNLNALYLQNCPTYPPQLGEIQGLEILDLMGTPIISASKFSEELHKLFQIRILNLSQTALSEWPQSIKYLNNLTELNLSNNELYHWPQDFARWPEMEVDISANFLPVFEGKSRAKLKGENTQEEIIGSSWPNRQFKEERFTQKELIAQRPKALFPLHQKQEIFLKAKDWKEIQKDFSFEGNLYLAKMQMEELKGTFKYEDYQLELKNVKHLKFKIPARKRDPKGLATDKTYPFSEFVASELSDLEGRLLMDTVFNKLGQWESSKSFPKLKTTTVSKVYYPNYEASDLHLEVLPFELEGINHLDLEKLKLPAKLETADILELPPLELELMLDDLSFGFEKSVQNLPLYLRNSKKGEVQFTGNLELSNEGLLGKGVLETKDWKATVSYLYLDREQIHFQADELQMNDGEGLKDVQVLYFPYANSIQIRDSKLPFAVWSAAGDQLKLDDALLYWPIPASSGKHYTELSWVQKASPWDFRAAGQLDFKFYFPLELANHILRDFQAAELDQLPKDAFSFTLSNLEMVWQGAEKRLSSQKEAGFSTKIQLNAILGQMVDRAVRSKVWIKPNQEGDSWEWYVQHTNGHWYYFHLKNNELQTISNYTAYNELFMQLKKKDLEQKLPNKQFFRIKLANMQRARFFVKD